MKPIKKWSKCIAWAMRDIRKDIQLKVYAFHNDPSKKTYVAIWEVHRSIFIIAFTEVVTRKKGSCKVVNGFLHSSQSCEYRKFRGRAFDQILARSPRSTIKLHIASCIERSQPVVEFEDGSEIGAKRMDPFDVLESRAKLIEILTDYLK